MELRFVIMSYVLKAKGRQGIPHKNTFMQFSFHLFPTNIVLLCVLLKIHFHLLSLWLSFWHAQHVSTYGIQYFWENSTDAGFIIIIIRWTSEDMRLLTCGCYQHTLKKYYNKTKITACKTNYGS